MTTRPTLLAVLLFLLPLPAFPQSTTNSPDLQALVHHHVVIETSDGSIFRGQVLAVSEDRVELVSSDAVIREIAREQIVTVREVPREADDAARDVSADRLIVAPTAFGTEQGRLIASNLELVGLTAAYGLSRNVSLWGGATINGTAFNARFSFEPVEDLLALSAGSFVGVNWFGSLTDIVIPYVSASVGSRALNLTVGLGGLFTLSTELPIYGDFSSFVLVVGGKVPLTSSLSIVTETWVLLPYDTFLHSFGEAVTVFPVVALRFTTRRLSLDGGLTLPFTADPSGFRGALGLFTSVYPLPVFSVSYRVL